MWGHRSFRQGPSSHCTSKFGGFNTLCGFGGRFRRVSLLACFCGLQEGAEESGRGICQPAGRWTIRPVRRMDSGGVVHVATWRKRRRLPKS